MMKLYSMTLITLSALTAFSGCNGGNDSSSNTPAAATINQTPQFLAAAGTDRFLSNGNETSLHFGSDGSFEMILDRKTLVQTTEAQCNIRVNGTAAYYQQKVRTDKKNNNQQTISGPTLEFTLSGVQVLSTKMLDAPSSSTLTADSICNQYAQDLNAKKVLHMHVVEYTSDHLILGERPDFGIPQAASTAQTLPSIWTYVQDNLGMTPMNIYFVRANSDLDITTSFLKTFADTSYVTDGESNNQNGEATLTLDAGLKELTISDSRCGLKYIIDIDSIKTDGGTPLLRGKIADRVVNIPASESSANGMTGIKCTDIQSMIEGAASAPGLEISGMQNMCTNNNCTSYLADLRIGQPGKLNSPELYAMDSVMLSFQSASVSSVRASF